MRPTAENVLFLHTVAVEAFEGSEGVRDLESLHAAVARPWGSSFGHDHFPTPFDKAAALAESIIRRHPFVDGNKRTAMYAAAYLLETFGYEMEADQQELEDFAVSVAEGGIETADIAIWFEIHSSEV
ncbi:MAG: type II toxin-antitoxin system death-on-curing family toxin [Rubrobacteraceae bacterium]|nr:type II toxin-antitoxin system death-on-curing family toxin [Rubrobacteraceae bacterium]